MGHSSSQPMHSNPQFHIGNVNAGVEKQRPADPGSQWAPSSLAAPPPYTSVVAPGVQINGRPTSRSSAAAGSSKTSESMTLPPGSRHTHIYDSSSVCLLQPSSRYRLFAGSNASGIEGKRIGDVAYVRYSDYHGRLGVHAARWPLGAGACYCNLGNVTYRT